MNKDDGGAAFARTGGLVEAHNSPVWVEPQEGMSLRDWFAGQALAGITTRVTGEALEQMSEGILGGARIAKAAYVFADAMLAERSK